MENGSLGEMIGGLVRHLVTTFGGVLVTGGYMSSSDLTTLGGAAAILIGVGWSLFVKKKTA